MNTHVEKNQQNNSKAVSNSLPRASIDGESESHIAYHPAPDDQRNLKEIVNNSRQVSQLKSYQAMADNSHYVKQSLQLQKMADFASNKPIQMLNMLDRMKLDPKLIAKVANLFPGKKDEIITAAPDIDTLSSWVATMDNLRTPTVGEVVKANEIQDFIDRCLSGSTGPVLKTSAVTAYAVTSASTTTSSSSAASAGPQKIKFCSKNYNSHGDFTGQGEPVTEAGLSQFVIENQSYFDFDSKMNQYTLHLGLSSAKSEDWYITYRQQSEVATITHFGPFSGATSAKLEMRSKK